jgi:hypothetical protein
LQQVGDSGIATGNGWMMKSHDRWAQSALISGDCTLS